MCGLAGVILVMNVAAFTDTTGAQFLIPIVAVAVLGGIGQPYGAMLGALVIGITSEVAAAIFNPEYKDVVPFVILVIVLLARPQGNYVAVDGNPKGRQTEIVYHEYFTSWHPSIPFL